MDLSLIRWIGAITIGLISAFRVVSFWKKNEVITNNQTYEDKE
jgi:hypothetical protein